MLLEARMKQRMVAASWVWLVFGTGLLALGCSGSSAVVGGNESGGTGGGSSDASPEQESLQRYSTRIRSDPGLCLPRELPLNANGSAACKIFAAAPSGSDSCACDTANRAPVSEKTRDAVRALAKEQLLCDEPDTPACADYCVCEDLPIASDDLPACLDSEEASLDGWCYVAPDVGLGTLSTPCEAGRQTVRFLGSAVFSEPEQGFMMCSRVSSNGGMAQPLGQVCVPSDEEDPTFSGFTQDEVVIDANSASCASSVCVVQHFQGRVSCPLGSPANAGECTRPGSNERVTAEVKPQLLDRPPSVASTCSCRCAGPGDGPFCSCGEGQACVPLVDDIGLPGDSQAGSYCLPKGATEPSRSIDSCRDEPEKCADRLY
jgi:hypothetical protein